MQHDYTISDGAAVDVRVDINNAIQSAQTKNSGSSAPAITFANMSWYDTGLNILKQRNADNNAWLDMFIIDLSASKVTAAGGVPVGTSMVFNQASAPIGWTKKSNWANNASLIIGNTYGYGGSDSPTSWTPSVGIADHVAHTHTGGSHTHAGTSHAHTYNTVIAHTHKYTSALIGSSTGGSSASTTHVNFPTLNGGTTTSTGSSSGTTAAGGTGNTGSGGTGNTSTSGPTTHTVTQDTYTPIYQVLIAASRD